MTHHHGYLFIEDDNGFRYELFNHARTAAYLTTSSVLGCGKVYGVLEDGGCPAYAWVPPDTVGLAVLTDSDGNILTDDDGHILTDDQYTVSEDGWVQEVYTNPVDDFAPWYNADFPESGQALGVWITEWTGLDSGNIRREVVNVGNYRGGGAAGALGNTFREMGFEIILLGESEAALDYLYRWLDATLASVCATCAKNTILLRRICPVVDDEGDGASDGVVEMRQVLLTQGLEWGPPPIERQGCFMRRATFTMAALDPCMYGFCTDVEVAAAMDWDACFAAATLDPDRNSCRPSCSEMDGQCRLTFDYTVSDPSAVAPIVTITAPTTAPSITMRIRTYANPLGLPPEDLCGAPLLGELYVNPLPPWTELRYDVAERKVFYRNAGTGGWVNGFAYLQPNEPGVPRWFGLGCGDFTTIIEPADFCFETPPSDDLEYPDVTLQLRPRMNCA